MYVTSDRTPFYHNIDVLYKYNKNNKRKNGSTSPQWFPTTMVKVSLAIYAVAVDWQLVSAQTECESVTGVV